MGSNHTPGTLCTIPSGVLRRFVKLTSRKPSFHSERVDKIYLNHTNALCKVGIAHPIFPTMGELWKNKDEKMDIEN